MSIPNCRLLAFLVPRLFCGLWHFIIIRQQIETAREWDGNHGRCPVIGGQTASLVFSLNVCLSALSPSDLHYLCSPSHGCFVSAENKSLAVAPLVSN